jgi:hypothetical protein
MRDRIWIKRTRPVTPADLFWTVLLAGCFALAIILCLCGCSPPDAEHSSEARRIVVVAQDGWTSVYRDMKTGCEFLDSKAGYGEAIVYIPGTCEKP